MIGYMGSKFCRCEHGDAAVKSVLVHSLLYYE